MVALRDGLLSVFNLHDLHSDSVVITHGGRKLKIAPGTHVSLSNLESERYEVINPAEGICHRSMRHVAMDNGLHVFTSEVAIPSVVKSVNQLRALFQANHPAAQRLAGSIAKTTAILYSLSRSQEPYLEMPHPRLTASATR
jgi:hypothetical protein